MSDEVYTYDVMQVSEGRTFRKVDAHGFVRLVDLMPRICPVGRTPDYAVVQAARCSTGLGLKDPQDDERLLRYLLRHRHTTPFEMIETKWAMAMPIFVARQFIRHRTASVNELSGRYSQLPSKFFIPSPAEIRRQSTTNKQGSDVDVLSDDIAARCVNFMTSAASSYEEYEELLRQGVSREQARCGLPLNIYTEWYWKMDMHNLMHFLQLRLSTHAQQEIRVYAEAIYNIAKIVFPETMRAFKDYMLDALYLTGPELRALRDNDTSHLTRRECAELENKKIRLGL